MHEEREIVGSTIRDRILRGMYYYIFRGRGGQRLQRFATPLGAGPPCRESKLSFVPLIDQQSDL